MLLEFKISSEASFWSNVASLWVVGYVTDWYRAQPMGGWVHYIMVLELQVETPDWYGMNLLDKVLWLRSNMTLKS
jgi:hypothetical protein